MRRSAWLKYANGKWVPLKIVDKIGGYFPGHYGTKQEIFDLIIHYLGSASEVHCELISTLYAVWNDRLIKEETVTDELLIDDFYAWSDRKKTFTKPQIEKAISWMKEKGFEPQGFGSLIKRKKSSQKIKNN